MSNIFDCMTEELSITGSPEQIDILWDDPVYIVVRGGYANMSIIAARINRFTDDVTFDDAAVSSLALNDAQRDEMERRLIKYKDRIIDMHLKHESLHIPVRRIE